MNEFGAKIKYEGPAVEDNSMDAQKLGKAILGLNSAFRKYVSKEKKWVDLEPVLRVKTNSGSLTIVAVVIALAYVADKMGLTEFSKSFFSEMGKQIALKKFAKGKELKKDGNPVLEGGRMYFTLINIQGEKMKVEADTYNSARDFNNDTAAIVDPIESEKINSMRYMYQFDGHEEIIVNVDEKKFFETNEISIPELDLEEEFDEGLAEEIPPIKGKLVAYQAMATKYPFQFQPRERPDIFGRRFIFCILENEDKRDDYIELMKTSHSGYVIVKGRGIKDSSGLYRKIKIVAVEEDKDSTLF